MSKRYRFSSDQIPQFKQQVHNLRTGLKVYDDQTLPKVAAFLDIWARCLGYEGYQALIRQSRGHDLQPDYPVKLTPEAFVTLSEALDREMPQSFTLEQCRWAVAGLHHFMETVLSDQTVEQVSKLITLQEAEVLVPGDRQWLIEAGFLIPHGQAPKAVVLSAMPGAAYDITLLGQYVIGRMLECRLGHPLGRIALLDLGLPDSLCRLQAIHRTFTLSWGAAQPISRSITLSSKPTQPLTR